MNLVSRKPGSCSLMSGLPRKTRFIDERTHAALDAMPGDFIEPDPVDARILVVIFHLRAAFLHVLVDADGPDVALHLQQRIAHRADLQGEIARRMIRDVEMLVEHGIGWAIDAAMLPVHAREILILLAP